MQPPLHRRASASRARTDPRSRAHENFDGGYEPSHPSNGTDIRRDALQEPGNVRERSTSPAQNVLFNQSQSFGGEVTELIGCYCYPFCSQETFFRLKCHKLARFLCRFCRLSVNCPTNIAESEITKTLLQLELCTAFPRLNKLTMKTMMLFGNDELVKVFLRGLLSDECAHGVPLDTLPPETELTFDTVPQSDCRHGGVLHSDAVRHRALLHFCARSTGDQVWRCRLSVTCVKTTRHRGTCCSLHTTRSDLVPERASSILPSAHC